MNFFKKLTFFLALATSIPCFGANDPDPIVQKNHRINFAQALIEYGSKAQLFPFDVFGNEDRWRRMIATLDIMTFEELESLLQNPESLAGVDKFTASQFQSLLFWSQNGKTLYSKDGAIAMISLMANRSGQRGPFANSLVLELATQILDIKKKMTDFINSGELDIRPETTKHFLNVILTEYIERIDRDSIEKILLELLKLPVDATNFDRFKVIIHECGPFIQKLLQMIARDKTISADLAKTLKSLESGIRPADWLLVQLTVARAFPNEEPIHISISPVGSGSMAQVHQTKFHGLDAAVRVNRPGIGDRIQLDENIFWEITPIIEKDPKLKGTAYENFGEVSSNLAKSIHDELDVVLLTGSQIRAKQVYIPIPGLSRYGQFEFAEFHVSEIYAVGKPEYGVFIMEFAQGVSADDYFALHPLLKLPVSEEIARLWLREALFMSGYFHADLHMGNLKFKGAANNKTFVTIMDYGLHGTLTRAEQKALLKISIDLKNKNAASVSKMLLEDLHITLKKLSRTRFDEIIQEAVEQKMDLQNLLEKLMSEKAGLTQSLTDFNRGLWMIDKILADAGSQQTASELAAEMGKYLVGRDFKNLINPLVSFSKTLRTSPFSKFELIQIGCGQILDGVQ